MNVTVCSFLFPLPENNTYKLRTCLTIYTLLIASHYPALFPRALNRRPVLHMLMIATLVRFSSPQTRSPKIEMRLNLETDGPHMTDTHTVASTFVKIPPEVLYEIFLGCSNSGTGILVVDIPPESDFYPWRLGHVCSQWREIIWNSPTIWSNIRIRFDYAKVYPRPNVLSDILSRTKSLITLATTGWLQADILYIILTNSHRFKCLSFEALSMDSLIALFELPRGSLDLLESLLIGIRGAVFDTPPSGYFKNIRHRLPSLRKLRITGYTIITSHLPYFPYSLLTDLSIEGGMISPVTIHSILKRCNSLVFAAFRINEKDFDHEALQGLYNYKTTDITLPILKYLKITLSPPLDWASILHPLILPSLETFASLGVPSPAFPNAVASLLRRSKCSLRHFSIDLYYPARSNSTHPDLTHVLELTPNLISFATGCVATPALIRLVYSGLLPQLTSGSWKVNPEGLCALLDCLDEGVAQPVLPLYFSGTTRITCLGGPEFTAAYARYSNSYERYKAAGVDIIAEDDKGRDICSL